MGITGGFGALIDFERGTVRRWVMGPDGIKRWADTNEPLDAMPEDGEEQSPHDAGNKA